MVARLSIVASDWSTSWMQMRTRNTRNGRGEENLVGNGDNGLSYLVTHAINPRRRCDRRLLVERCWMETFLSQILRRWGITSVARHLDWALFSAVDRIPLAKRRFSVRIWHNMSRAASLMLTPCDCFIELYAAAGATLALIPATATFVPSRWDTLVWLLNCCSPLHWGQYLRESSSKDQRNVGDLVAFTLDL